METTQLAYDVCRCYLQDRFPLLFELGPKIEGYLRSRDLARLCNVVSLYDWNIHSVETFRTLKQIEAFFKKNEAFSDDESCTASAKNNFFNSEVKCRITNRRLDYYFAKRHRLDADLNKIVNRAESFISRVLGPIDPFVSDLPRYIRVTSGATASRSRRESLPYLKVRKSYQCSVGAQPYLQSLCRYFGYGDLRLRVSSINRVEVVPKNWKTHRTIACEPDGNLPFQLAFDQYAKMRLRRFGLDLSSQFENQELARIGSIDGSLATIDLSSASDTVAYNTVAWLFPKPWFDYLCAFRSSCFKGSFGYGKYSKFSSMGNGTTFAIETLVFAALCHAVGSKSFRVYGDDIVIETRLYPELMRALKFFGFVVNQDKSFATGPFRESCGKHWFNGVDVTPFYLRGNIKLKPDVCHIVNGLVKVGLPLGNLWSLCRSLLERHRLPLVPYNDQSVSGVFITPYNAYSKGLIKTKWSISRYKCLVPKNKTRTVSDTRTLFLWYLDAFRIPPKVERLALIRSRTPRTDRRYVRKWVGWFYPTGPTPGHLYWWSDYIAREI